MSAWIKSFRLFGCFLMVSLTIMSFVFARINIFWEAVIAVFFITSATMLQNDWRDRFHDIHKDKMLAFQQPRKFFALLLIFWLISWTLIGFIVALNLNIGIVLIIFTVVGIVYSETRMIPFIPIVLVSFASAGPVIFPLVMGANSGKLFLLFFSTVFIVFAREIIKDLDDEQIDNGYKWTIPLAFGEQRARILTAIIIIVWFVLVVKISLMLLLVIPFVVIVLVALICGAKPLMVKRYLNMVMVLVIFLLIIFE
ncbi:MAG: UbiA family prenyltransferase [Burkholderiales bacterium]|nr:UbiA family prenyltransferase [Burkholderiales bacterium]